MAAAALLLGLSAFIAGCGGSNVPVTGSGSGGSGGSGAPTLASIGVTPAAPSIALGTHQQFAATAVYSDNTKQDITSSVTWASTTASVATIGTAAGTMGLASAVGAGSATITATQGGVSGSTTLTVTAATLVSIAVTPANPSIAKGLTQQFTATGTYTNSTTQDLTSMVSWTSSNPSIASIAASGGLATAAAPGSVTVTASMSGITGTTTLTVTAAALVSIAVTSPAPSIANGTQQQFTATGTYTDGTTQSVTGMATWSSSAPAVASVGAATGLAKALSVGSTTITATLNGVPGSTTLAVTAATLASIAVTPVNPVILNSVTTQHNTTQLTATGTYTDGTTQDLTAMATWTSATPAVATISSAAGSSGLATGLTLGTTSITAAFGGIPSPPRDLSVKPAEYAYVANFGSDTVSQYTIGTGGVLTPNAAAATVLAGHQPYSIAADPTGNYLYAANYNSNGAGSVSQYTIGTDGALTPNTAGPTVPTQNGPNGITVDPAGTYVYVANYGSGSVSEYIITPSGANAGSLTFVADVPSGTEAASVALDPLGRYAYVPNYGTDTISVFTISAGAFTFASTTTLAAGSAPSFALVDPSGQYLYVADQADSAGPGPGSIAQFTIGAGGALTPMSTPTIALGNPSTPRSLTLDPTGTSVYVADSSANSVFQFAIGAGGALTLTSTTVVGAESAPNFVAVDSTGQYAYVDNRGSTPTPGSTVSQYVIGTASALVPASTSTVAAGSQPAGIATTKAHP
jgi:6-phosphogluconolactonase (cycloisomerase 2 family)